MIASRVAAAAMAAVAASAALPAVNAVSAPATHRRPPVTLLAGSPHWLVFSQHRGTRVRVLARYRNGRTHVLTGAHTDDDGWSIAEGMVTAVRSRSGTSLKVAYWRLRGKDHGVLRLPSRAFPLTSAPDGFLFSSQHGVLRDKRSR